MDRFELQGSVYYQQGRKCGKSNCQCASGKLHGPYWYVRHIATGQVKYLGKELPVEVAQARATLKKVLPKIRARQKELSDKRYALDKQIDALEYLMAGRAISDGDTKIIQSLEFGKCLVQRYMIADNPGTRQETVDALV